MADRIDPLKDIRIGMTGSLHETVTVGLTVGGHVSGMPLVYATPMMIMAMEKASGVAIANHLPRGWVTVGSAVDIRHFAPTSIGRTVIVTARVLEIEGRSVLFEVEAHDGERKIGEGRHRRNVVNLERFAERYGV